MSCFIDVRKVIKQARKNITLDGITTHVILHTSEILLDPVVFVLFRFCFWMKRFRMPTVIFTYLSFAFHLSVFNQTSEIRARLAFYASIKRKKKKAKK